MIYIIPILILFLPVFVFGDAGKQFAQKVVSVAAQDGLGDIEFELLSKFTVTLYEKSGLNFDPEELEAKLKEIRNSSKEYKQSLMVVGHPLDGKKINDALEILRAVARELKGKVIASYEIIEFYGFSVEKEDGNTTIELSVNLNFNDDVCRGVRYGYNYILGINGKAEPVAGGDAAR